MTFHEKKERKKEKKKHLEIVPELNGLNYSLCPATKSTHTLQSELLFNLHRNNIILYFDVATSFASGHSYLII